MYRVTKGCLTHSKNCTISRKLMGNFGQSFFTKLITCLISLLLIDNSYAQITVTQNSNATALTQMLVGSGVTISNVTMNCNTAASGTFTNVSSNIGLSQGVVMATGKVSSKYTPVFLFQVRNYALTVSLYVGCVVFDSVLQHLICSIR